MLTECQHGFRKKRSTESALNMQKDLILQNIEKKLLTLGLYLDFSKAFDRVNHQLLLTKLERYGFQGITLELIRSYLKSRHQFVEINDNRSQTKPITAGVPQGSILGPIFFLYYINDIVEISDMCKFVAYADDCSIFFTGKDLEEITPIASTVCNKIQRWSKANCLILNEAKTKCVIFRAQGSSITFPDNIVLGPYTITITSSMKTLGVIFTAHMSWNDHVGNICAKVRKVVGLLNRYRNTLPYKIKRLIYHALFHSHLTYCSLIWGNTTAQNIRMLETLQKKAVRAIANVSFSEHTEELFRQIKIIKAGDIWKLKTLQCYKSAMLGKIDSFLTLADLQENKSTYSYRRQAPWQIPFSRTNYGQQRLCHTLPSLLNHFNKQSVDVLPLNKNKMLDLFL